MDSTRVEATPLLTEADERPLPARMARWMALNPLLVMTVCYFLAKYTLYTKIGLGYLDYDQPVNDFFPKAFYYVNPLFLDLTLLALIVTGERLAFACAAVISFVQVIHPHSFGYQHYVMSLYMFIWLALKDRDGSVFFGRATLSFLYLAATIGKATPGWISGEHFGTYLRHLQQDPYLIIGGEFLFGIAFLLPFYLGVIIPAGIVFGMIYSISWGIFDAVGPILGMLISFVAYREYKATPLAVTFADSRTGRAGFRVLRFLDLPNITAAMGGQGRTTATEGGTSYTGQQAYHEAIARIPALAWLYPVLTVRSAARLFRY